MIYSIAFKIKYIQVKIKIYELKLKFGNSEFYEEIK